MIERYVSSIIEQYEDNRSLRNFKKINSKPNYTKES